MSRAALTSESVTRGGFLFLFHDPTAVHVHGWRKTGLFLHGFLHASELFLSFCKLGGKDKKKRTLARP